MYAVCQDKGLLGPPLGVFFVREILKSADFICPWYLGDKVCQIDIAAGERPMQDIREDIAAVNFGFVFTRKSDDR